MVNMAVIYDRPDGLSARLWAETQALFGPRAQNKGFVSGYRDGAYGGAESGHYPDQNGITHAVDIGVDIEGDGTGLTVQDGIKLAAYLDELGRSGRMPGWSRWGYRIHRQTICGAFNGWVPQPYAGVSPHLDHVHVSVVGDNPWGEPSRATPAEFDSTASWNLAAAFGGGSVAPSTSPPKPQPVVPVKRKASGIRGDVFATPDGAKRINGLGKGVAYVVDAFATGRQIGREGNMWVRVHWGRNDVGWVHHTALVGGSNKTGLTQVDANGPRWTISKGDTLTKIADHYYGQTSDGPHRIATHNGINLNGPLTIGEALYIPGPLVWTVEAGDTLAKVDAYYGYPAGTTAARNSIKGSTIKVGQELNIWE